MKKTMKSVLRSFVACLLAVLMVVPVMATEATTESELPNAEVEKLESVVITEYQIFDGALSTGEGTLNPQIVMKFTAKDSAEEAEANGWGEYYTDFYITIKGMSDESIVADENCYLVGNYGEHGWIMIPLEGLEIVNGKVNPVVSRVVPMKYLEICDTVKEFTCGIHFSEEILKANPNLEVTLELGLSETEEAAQNAEFLSVGSYTYTNEDLTSAFDLPNAEVIDLGATTVGNIGDDSVFDVDSYYEYALVGDKKLTEKTENFDLSVTMQFLAKDTPVEAAKNFYGDYTTDFYITMEGMSDVSITGDAGCYLAGYYAEFGGWVKIPLEGFTIEAGKVYPVITSAGFDFSYVDICTSVQDFICGIHLSDEILTKNPDLKVTLELGLSKNMDAALATKFTSVDEAYTYTATELSGKATFKGASVTLGESLSVNYYVALKDGVEINTVSAKFVSGEKTATATGVAGTGNYVGYYVFSFEGVTPQCIGDNIEATLYIGDKVADKKDEYSVKQNLANLQTKELKKAEAERNAALLALLDNTIAYGAAAQAYRNYNLEAPIAKDWDNTTTTVKSPTAEDSVLYITPTTQEGVYFKSATVWFSNVNSLAFKYVDKTNTAKVFVTVNNGEVKEYTPVLENDVYVIQTSGITALQMDDIYTVELVVDGETVQTLTYSVNSYIYSKTNSEDKLATPMGQLALALYNYGIAAEAYSHNS